MGKVAMFADQLGHMQFRQELHDMLFHSDIYTLGKKERLVHLVLHHCKYVSELANYLLDPDVYASLKHGPLKPRVQRLTIDGLIVSFSMLNTVNRQVSDHLSFREFESYAEASRLALRQIGLLAKTVENIDHLAQDNPLNGIIERVAVLIDIYWWIYSETQGRSDDNKSVLQSMNERLIGVEKKNIFFTQRSANMSEQLKLAGYDTDCTFSTYPQG